MCIPKGAIAIPFALLSSASSSILTEGSWKTKSMSGIPLSLEFAWMVPDTSDDTICRGRPRNRNAKEGVAAVVRPALAEHWVLQLAQKDVVSDKLDLWMAMNAEAGLRDYWQTHQQYASSLRIRQTTATALPPPAISSTCKSQLRTSINTDTLIIASAFVHYTTNSPDH